MPTKSEISLKGRDGEEQWRTKDRGCKIPRTRFQKAILRLEDCRPAPTVIFLRTTNTNLIFNCQIKGVG